ncbi:MAG TPA: FlgD immunoglobulin-like domain containing protein [Bacteroidia bacterium]|nr:FlgD immunoglobulin-like domain containing protein [Bacteroidia bacterium]
MKKLILSLIILFSLNKSVAQPYYKDVASAFYANCTSCHNQYSHGPSFLNYSGIMANIANIKHYIITGYMPAWTPDTTYTRFLHEHSITAADKAAILNWIAAGSQAGDTTLAPPAPVYTRYQINVTPDLEVTIPTFTSNASTADSYVCFALPMGLTQDRIIRAYEIVAGNPSIVHHVVATIDTTGTVNSNLAGNCYTQPGDFGIGGYAPGASPTVFPNTGQLRMGMRIKAGSKIILQLHYPKGTAGQVDSTKIRFYFYPVGATGVRPVYANTLLQNWNLNIPANTVKTFTSVYPASGTLPYSVSMFATFPHSHKLATSIINYAFSGVDTIPLVRIKNWDFNQQGYYTYRHMPKVPNGYKIFSSHVYDNTTNNANNPSSPPVNVVAGTNTTDEMLFDSYEWLVYQTGDEKINVDSLFANDPLVASIKQSNVVSNLKSYAFPNPFENNVNIGYILDKPSKVSVEIYSIQGALVRTMPASFETPGSHETAWDGKNNQGASVTNGVYFYVLKTAAGQSTGKLTLLSGKN